MHKFVARLALLAMFACPIGCDQQIGSSKGKTLHVISFGPRKETNATAEQVNWGKNAFRNLPQNTPGTEYYDFCSLEKPWKTLEYEQVLFMILEAPTRLSECQELRREGATGGGFSFTANEYVDIHDETPSVVASYRGRIRRFIYAKIANQPDAIHAFEKEMRALPIKYPSIERLQWVLRPYSGPAREKNDQEFLVLLTFKDRAARDACVSNADFAQFENEISEQKGGFDCEVK